METLMRKRRKPGTTAEARATNEEPRTAAHRTTPNEIAGTLSIDSPELNVRAFHCWACTERAERAVPVIKP
jgi:hypothetical protein